jgi:metal iron transporter
MPHSLYLGSGLVQPRLREFDDAQIATNHPDSETDSLASAIKYKPSLAAIQSCMSYSIVELAISLFTFALFVNSAILIVAGASLYGLPEADDADLFSIHALLSRSIAPVAGTLFALALLLSGTSAGIVCTISGQMVSEGQLNWSIKPWLRRLITRSISITPSIIIAGAVGREGLGRALMGSQVALSVILPVVSAPLIWFTGCGRYMKVAVRDGGLASAGGRGNRGLPGDGARPGEMEREREGEMDVQMDRVQGDVGDRHVQMRNHWVTACFAVVIWGVIVVMNIALLVLVGLGVA